MGKARFRRGSIIQQAPLSRTVIVGYHDSETGKRKQQWVTVRGATEREAQQKANAKLTELLKKLDEGEPVRRSKDTVEEWLKTWLRDIVSVRNAPRTRDSYDYLCRCHIIPSIGQKKLSKLQATDVDKMLAEMVKPREEGGKGLSANTAHHAYVALQKALKDARRKKKVFQNICEDVDPPTPGRYEPEIPEADGIAKVLALANEKEPELAPIFRFIAYTGVRRSEACGLKWSAVDFDNGIVSIVQTVQRLPKQGLVELPPKSKSARRSIDLDDDTLAMLREHQGKQLLRKMEMEGCYKDRGIVFASPAGGYLDPGIATRTWQDLRDKAGYPGLKLHGARHAHTAGLIRAGTHVKVIQERLGHHSAAFTLDVYGHVGKGMGAQAARAFAALMKKVSR